jgi:CHAT domain
MAGRIPQYDELKLRIERGPGDVYHVVAFAADGSTAEGSFSPPFSKTELDNFVLRVGLPRRNVRTYRSSQMEEARRFGAELSHALLQDQVREVYLGARRIAETHDRGLRVTLYLTGVPELMEIPWEFLYERPSFLSQSIYTPLVRSLDLRTVRQPRKVALPLRVLGMVSSPRGFDALDVEEEREKLERALQSLRAAGMVEVHWLESATLSELERAIAGPDEQHVLHYVGHGAYDERTQSGILLLENADGGSHEVTGEELGSLLHDERSLRLAVLNSCEGARTSHVDPFSGVASSLLECGIPAVIGMQFEITDDAAITLSERLYFALAQALPVDAALAQARKAIFAAGHEIEFGTPVLFLRGADAKLFDVESLPATRPTLATLPPINHEEDRPSEPPEPTRGGPPRRSLRVAVAAAVAALAVAAGAVAVAASGGDEPQPAPPAADPVKKQPAPSDDARGDEAAPTEPATPAAPSPRVTYRDYTPTISGYTASIPTGAGWSSPVESEPTPGRRYRATINGPGRLFALIDYTPHEPAAYNGDHEIREEVEHPLFGSAIRYVSREFAEPLCQGTTCVDYIMNDNDRGAGYAVLAGGGDPSRADRLAWRIAESLEYRPG